jgi:hypothetical protein
VTDPLAAVFSTSALDALEARIARVVDARIDELGGRPRRRWRTVPETASELGVTENAVYQRIRRGQLAAIRQGSRLYVDVDRLGD